MIMLIPICIFAAQFLGELAWFRGADKGQCLTT